MKRLVISIISIVALAGTALVVMRSSDTAPDTSRSLLAGNIIGSLPKKDASGIDTSHLADGIMPPTNKWFSGIALQEIPMTVFPTPLSFIPTSNSFTVDLPGVQTTEKSILNTAANPTIVTIQSSQYYHITRYDEISVDLTYFDINNQALATVTIASGSPYVYIHGKNTAPVAIRSTSPFNTIDTTTFRTAANSSVIGISSFYNAPLQQIDGSVTGTVHKDGLITLYASSSNDSNETLRQSADARVTGVAVDYEKKDTVYSTSINLQTDTKKPTIYSVLPHQQNEQKKVFSLDTLYGKQQFIQSDTVTFSTPAIPALDSLDISNINEADKTILKTQLRHDINATQITAEDTYFAGKQMYRSAQLLDLAVQLGETDSAATIQQKLQRELTLWLKQADGRSKKAFYFDTKIKGIVGQTPSFGSDEFNDHHFHYGYFIYAASILAKYSTDFKQQYQPMVDLLVADIANYQTDTSLPLRRSFDPYFGHSWASGSSPFNDGNNQESASEAINAWVATSLWATQTNNQTLRKQSDWMLSNEVQSTMSYWLNYDQNQAPYNQNYTHSISPLNWGGKRDYATFFSAEPSAMLGILLIPMNPTMITYSSLGPRINTIVIEAALTESSQFSDYILMLDSLYNEDNQIDVAKKLSDEMIDNANSRSYMYAWIMSQTKK